MTDDRIERLYGLPLADFTPERNALASELRAAGEGERAAAVKALRKPSAAAWAVNQLVRAEPELVEALLGAGGELRQAHRQAASGRGAEQLRVAAEAERAAIEQLLARLPSVIGRAPSAALAESVRNTLHAASSDDEARERVASGTLTTELRPVGLGPVPAAVRGGQKRARPEAAEREEQARAAERERMERAATANEVAHQREVDAAKRALDRAEEAAERARLAAEAAMERVLEARKRVRAARAGLTEAQRARARLDRG